jgi:cell wall-associated NlpC family hydrolase
MLVVGMAASAAPAFAQDDPNAPSGGGAAAPNSGGGAQQASTTQGSAQTQSDAKNGGAEYGSGTPGVAASPTPLVNGPVAQILPSGLAAAPTDAPAEVQQAIWAANRIIGLPYVYGGGHNAQFRSRGYDCSGTVSYALHGGRLLSAPLDSGSFMHWGQAGQGAWMTIWTNPGHAFLIVAGIRLDTSSAGDPSGKHGPRWRPMARVTKGFHARHPVGF